MKKLSKPSVNNLKIVCEVLYNFTGLEYYLSICNTYSCKNMEITFFEFYYDLYNEAKEMVKNGETFKFPLYNLETKEPKPFIYNSL